MITLADVASYEYGASTYDVTFNDDEYNLIVLLLSSLTERDIFSDYDDNPDFADALYADTQTALMEFGESPVSEFAPGMIMAYAPSGAPSGWLRCDGSAVSRTAYSALFSAIGITYGAGDGTTTFNLPDTDGRTLVAAGIASYVGTKMYAAGNVEGRDEITLDIANIPPHSHSTADNGTGSGRYMSVASPYQGNDSPAAGWRTAETGGNPLTGEAQPFPIIPTRSAVGGFIIKV